MGMRERGKWTLPMGQGGALGVLCALFLLGGLAGCLFVRVAGDAGALALSTYLADYLALARDTELRGDLWLVIWEQLRYLLITVILGLTGIGMVGIPLLFCTRGFLFTFSIGCFCRAFGGAGLVPAMVLFGLPALLWAPALFWAGLQGLASAQSLVRRTFGDSRCPLPFVPMYWFRIGLCSMMYFVCSSVEYFIVPVLLRAAARVVL